MDNSSSQILSQIFGHTSINEQQIHPVVSTGGRNQYVEIDRFETEDQLKNWLHTQNRKWGIVQKGRITIEDIIDQYACIFRRRKGYACRVQMRVRHNRRSGHKIVEVLPVPHDHNFYGPLMVGPLTEFDDGTVPDQMSQIPSNEHVESQDLQDKNSLHSSKVYNNEEHEFEEKTGECSTDIHFQNQSNLNGEQALSQPMEMLWSNILNNHSIHLFSNEGGNSNAGYEESPEDFDDHLKEEDEFEVENGSDGDVNLINDAEDHDGETKHLNEAFISSIVERVAGQLSVYIDSKFDAIIETLNTVTRSVDDLKHSVTSITKIQQHNQKQHQHPINSQLSLGPFDKQLAAASRIATFSRPLCQNMLQRHRQVSPSTTFQRSNQTKTGSSVQQHSQNSTTNCLPINASPQQHHLDNSKIVEDIQRTVEKSKQQYSSNSACIREHMPSTLNPSSTDGLKLSKLFSQEPGISKTNFSSIMFLKNPIKTARKSRHAYRQRRRELSYKFMKEVGMLLTINGCKKTIFHWRASEIFSACQTKRRELVVAGKHVMYRGIVVTEKIYRVDCSRDLVNGRKCGQMISDSLWPRGYFQRRMLLPILKGVNHRSKKRVNGVARSPVADDQFETFKVALLLLGGFLMDETDRYKWMETAREGVNQRGLDELANSKRAHYEYDGGPLFANDIDNNEYINEVVDGALEEGIKVVTQEDEVEKGTAESFSELTANLEFLKNYETPMLVDQLPL